MQFSQFAKILESIESTTLRNRMTEELAGLFGQLDKEEIESACWLLLGRIYPPYEGIEFQFADKMMVRAIAQTYSQEVADVTKAYKDSGDLGVTAQGLARGVSSSQTISAVFGQLRSLAAESGGGSQDRKLQLMVEILNSLDPLSVRYIVRIVLGRLRLGFSDMTILDALSWTLKGDKSDRKILEDAYQNKHDIGKLATAYLTHKEKGLENFDIELGIPIQPALCQRLKTPEEMIEKMGKIVMESKYDGTRVQIHVSSRADDQKRRDAGGRSWEVRTFTRSLEESSAMFPELQHEVHALGEHSYIFDCEAVGFDRKSGKLLPFQETIQRKRKHGVAEKAIEIPLNFYVFDIMYEDGKSLLSTPLFQRKKLLDDLFSKSYKEGGLDFPFVKSKYEVTQDPEELRVFHKQQLDAGLEGAVIKQYDSVYQPGRKGFSWVKFKEEETATGKLSDTIDAVVMGYWYGKGKRTGFGVGAFLIGIAGVDGQILTLSKVGTGLSDEQWRELKERCAKALSVEKPKSYVVDKLLVPDVWVDPQIIVEVAGDELTVSPNHSAGHALRFPRLVRFRDDKSLADITSKKELASIK